MPSRSKMLFDRHIRECREAIVIYDHIERISIYKPDFSLRFVWIAGVSAFDHYVSQLILERATEAFSNGDALTSKLMSDVMTFSHALEFKAANSVDSVLLFRAILKSCIQFRSFQNPTKVADGLSYIWTQKHKWYEISRVMSLAEEDVKETLDNIVSRRNMIAHSADYDEALGSKIAVSVSDAQRVVDFMHGLTEAIDQLCVGL